MPFADIIPGPRARVRLVSLITATAAVVAGLVAAPAAVAPAPAQAASGARAVSSGFDSRVLHWTNVERKKRGLRPLRAATCPDRYAASHTKRMAKRDRLSHQRLRPVMRQCRMRTAGENVAWSGGSTNARQVVRRWMRSQGHRANILKPRYSRLGIDAYRSGSTGRLYVGQVFGG